ncbi:hypothetical protein JXM67_01030 [candidate division WOR-3 bacterium]|nr:hypothetical protein [candidate division WOR-3 bacterium]
MTFLGLEIKDWIQIGVMVVLLVTLIISIVQASTQNRLFKAQILNDVITMYWKTYEPISEDEMTELQRYPETFMAKSIFERKYQSSKTAMHDYLYLAKVYKYLIFAFALRKYKLADPFTTETIETWAEVLVKDDVFLDVHANCERYYSLFANYIDKLISMSKRKKGRPNKG